MGTSTVIALLFLVTISTSYPVRQSRNVFPAEFSPLHPLIDPTKLSKTPASTIPINFPSSLLRSLNPASIPASSIPVNYVGLSDPSFITSPEYKAHLQDTYALLLAETPAGTRVPIQYLAEPDPNLTISPEYKGFLQDMYARLQDLYEAFVERRDSLLNLIYCRNCTGNHTAWQNFMNALTHIPSLGWVARPNAEISKPGISFLVATNDNGVVTGVGGSYVNNQPIVQYTFNSTHMTPVKPPRPVKPTKLFPEENLLGEIMQQTTKK